MIATASSRLAVNGVSRNLTSIFSRCLLSSSAASPPHSGSTTAPNVKPPNVNANTNTNKGKPQVVAPQSKTDSKPFPKSNSNNNINNNSNNNNPNFRQNLKPSGSTAPNSSVNNNNNSSNINSNNSNKINRPNIINNDSNKNSGGNRNNNNNNVSDKKTVSNNVAPPAPPSSPPTQSPPSSATLSKISSSTPRVGNPTAYAVADRPLRNWQAEAGKPEILKTRNITIQDVKNLRSVLIQKDVPAIVTSLQTIVNCKDGVAFESGVDLVYQPLLAVVDALFVDSNNIITLVSAVSKLGFTWEKHRTFILHIMGKFHSKNLDELVAFVESVSDVADWDMLDEDFQKSLWGMMESACGPTPDIMQLRALLNMMSELNAKWSNIPPHFQQLIEAEMEALYQREYEKEKKDLAAKAGGGGYQSQSSKDEAHPGLTNPSELMMELFITLADMDYDDAVKIMEAEAVLRTKKNRLQRRGIAVSSDHGEEGDEEDDTNDGSSDDESSGDDKKVAKKK